MKQITALFATWLFVATVVGQSEPTYLKANTIVTGKINGTTINSITPCSDIFLINTGLGEITIISDAAKVYRIKASQKKKSDALDYYEFTTVDRNNQQSTFLQYLTMEHGRLENIVLMLPDGINYSKYYVTLRKTF